MPANQLGNANKVASLSKPTSDSDFTNWWQVNDACLASGIRNVFELEAAFGALSTDEPNVNDENHFTLARLFMVIEKQLDELVTKVSTIEGDNPDGNQALFIGKAMDAQTMNASGKGIVQMHSNSGTGTNEAFIFDFGFGYNGGSVTTGAAKFEVGKAANFSTGPLTSTYISFHNMYKGISNERMKITKLGDVEINATNGVTAGWHGSSNRILLLPYMFMPNDDSSYFNRCVVDNGGQIMIKSSALELYCYFRIPYGYKATKFRIYGTPTTRTINLYSYDIDTNTASGVTITNGTLGANEGTIGTSGIDSTDTNYHAFKVATGSTLDRIHGGYVKIERIQEAKK